MPELTDPHIEEAVGKADELRARLGVPLDSPFTPDLLDAAENEVGLAVCILDLPPKIAGAYMRTGRRSIVFIQAENYPTRQRFTIAHELGHHCLGHGTIVESYKDVGRDTADPAEQQANYFASELLMPLAAVRKWLAENVEPGTAPTLTDVVRLAEDFQASPPAMLYRLSKGEFDGIDRALLDAHWDEVNGPKAHMTISDELGIGHGTDEISRLYDLNEWPRLPSGVDPELAKEIFGDVRKLFPPPAKEQNDADDRKNFQVGSSS